MTTAKWNVGAKIWFFLVIAAQWLTCINYMTMPAFSYSDTIRHAALVSGLTGLFGTTLYLWLGIGKKKAALYTILVISGIDAIVLLAQGAGSAVVIKLIGMAITFAIAHHHVN